MGSSSRPIPTPPTAILAANFAKTYANIHPALLLCLFGARFRALVDDTVPALLRLLPLLAVLQVVYAVLCLPPAGRAAGGDEDSVARSRAGKAGSRRKTAESGAGNGKITVCASIGDGEEMQAP